MNYTRHQLLEQLAWRRRDRVDILSELHSYGWDSDVDHFIMAAEAIIQAIQMALDASITEVELAQWAGDFECREDVGYKEGEEKLSDVLFCLANPEINDPLTKENLLLLQRECVQITT